MTIDQYIRSKANFPAKDLAKQLDISEAYLSQLRTGARKPGRVLSIKIQEITGGAVPVTSWDTEQAA